MLVLSLEFVGQVSVLFVPYYPLRANVPLPPLYFVPPSSYHFSFAFCMFGCEIHALDRDVYINQVVEQQRDFRRALERKQE